MTGTKKRRPGHLAVLSVSQQAQKKGESLLLAGLIFSPGTRRASGRRTQLARLESMPRPHPAQANRKAGPQPPSTRSGKAPCRDGPCEKHRYVLSASGWGTHGTDGVHETRTCETKAAYYYYCRWKPISKRIGIPPVSALDDAGEGGTDQSPMERSWSRGGALQDEVGGFGALRRPCCGMGRRSPFCSFVRSPARSFVQSARARVPPIPVPRSPSLPVPVPRPQEDPSGQSRSYQALRSPSAR